MIAHLKTLVAEAAPTPEDVAEQAAALPLTQRVEAILVTAERALSTTRIAASLDEPGKAVEAAIESLNASWEQTQRVMRIMRVAGGWRVQTIAEVAPVLHEAVAKRTQHKLSQAALETLSVIAYRQPVMRAEVEAIRGVACGEVLRGLMERRLVRIAGRAEELGRPILYGTTPDFLRIFGLGSIDDLPDVEGLDRSPTRTASGAQDTPDEATGSTAAQADGSQACASEAQTAERSEATPADAQPTSKG